MVKFFSDLYKGFKEFGQDIASVVNFFLLLIVYILGIGPVSIISKIFGKHFIDLRFKEKKSTWVKREQIESSDEYYRQF